MTPPILPNFFIAGASKCGTTALYHYLGQHPQVYMSPIKEPRYFGGADLPSHPDQLPVLQREQARLQAYLKGSMSQAEHLLVTEWDDYVKLFRNVRDEIAIGEASVSYLYLPSAAAAIRAKLPAARLIFLLRDPVDRLFSFYLLSRRHEARMPFRAWVLEAMHSGGTRQLEVRRIALDGGLYATQLRRFVDLFPREQVRFYLYESYRADVQAVLRDIFEFLGVDPSRPIDVSRRHNETLVPRFPAIDRLRRRILGKTSLTTWLPAPVGRAFQDFYIQRKGSYPLDPNDRRMVIEYYRDEILRTQDLIGADLSAWLR